MSIGIVVAMAESVLIVADGRQSDALTVITDDAQKITELTESLAVIEFGAVVASATVVEELKFNRQVLIAAGELIGFLRRSVQNAGASLVESITPDSTDMSRIKVGLLAGGIDADGVYVAGALHGHGMSEPWTVLNRLNPVPHFLVLGGETCRAYDYFERELRHAYQVSAGDQATFFPLAKRAAKRTISYAAGHDRTIGGRVRYCLIQQNQPTRRGVL